ncbi:MAG: ribulose-phosphate 3-epimerase [candidate division WOR-3 bacterium]
MQCENASRFPGQVKIAASILNCNFLKLGEEIKAIEQAGVDALHLDVMDGHFVPNLSFGVPILKSIRKITKLPIISHLMVIKPENLIDKFIDDSDGIIFHIEATKRPNLCVHKIHQVNKLAGISLNPDTPMESIFKYSKEIEEILVMSVHPGFGGQAFIPESLERVRVIKKHLASVNSKAMLAVDGGVNSQIAPSLIKAGVDILVAGTAIFHSSNYRTAIEKLRCSK